MIDDPLESLHEGVGPLPNAYLRFLIGLLAATALAFAAYIAFDLAPQI